MCCSILFCPRLKLSDLRENGDIFSAAIISVPNQTLMYVPANIDDCKTWRD